MEVGEGRDCALPFRAMDPTVEGGEEGVVRTALAGVTPALEVATAPTPSNGSGGSDVPVLNTPVMLDAGGNVTAQYVDKLKADQQVGSPGGLHVSTIWLRPPCTLGGWACMGTCPFYLLCSLQALVAAVGGG